MLRYTIAAIALKAFSSTEASRRLYRRVGNRIGRGRRNPDDYAVYSAARKLDFIARNGAIADGMHVLELGTGWVHFDALFTRLFYDVRVTMFDVWDCRLWANFCGLLDALEREIPQIDVLPAARVTRALAVLEKVKCCHDFAEVYALLGFTYAVDPAGSLHEVADRSVDLVFSSDVLEHVHEDDFPALANDLRRILGPGGHMSAQIATHDHLFGYDRSVHQKNYLRYSDRSWNLWFGNRLQYINRWQASDFERFFSEEGFDIVEREPVSVVDTGTLPLAARWQDYAREDLETKTFRILVRTRQGPAH